ncbi:putative reverse transcriptase-7 [Operophtera brumata]|uniref:Putative reverse transcriptase-7 n=1 Tax=Operophtera brumata TaxID=104452 RepID=A0A0L7LE93_OPEBR|nr:putative reverse transcriptase-7 [Operophtera brumata]
MLKACMKFRDDVLSSCYCARDVGYLHDLTLRSVSEVKIHPLALIYESKTDSELHIQSGWKLFSNAGNPNLDPVLWVKRLLSIRKVRRDTANIGSLFVTARGTAKAASKTVIAGWVKSVFREAGVDATPGSVRK